ncbi:hypothetical protein chiPu_0024187 [Chiloscyllium punctatum]|uniref:UBA domain-containing protein n=1 Tax=Chiloscyllium punctatum TaxID=137246 RepID=A0A401TCK3_CHIPU|nr:hypothetical protein [Chiloscyllium punctatum]
MAVCCPVPGGYWSNGPVLCSQMGEEQLVSPEEVCCALRSSGTEEPLAWLQTELPQMLDSIADLASQKGHTMAQDQVGPVSRDEARLAWLHAAGDFEEAVGECVRSRARKFREICAMGFADQQEVLQALYMNRGDVDKAVIDLQRQLLEPFHTHIWQEDEVPIHLDHPDREVSGHGLGVRGARETSPTVRLAGSG